MPLYVLNEGMVNIKITISLVNVLISCIMTEFRTILTTMSSTLQTLSFYNKTRQSKLTWQKGSEAAISAYQQIEFADIYTAYCFFAKKRQEMAYQMATLMQHGCKPQLYGQFVPYAQQTHDEMLLNVGESDRFAAINPTICALMDEWCQLDAKVLAQKGYERTVYEDFDSFAASEDFLSGFAKAHLAHFAKAVLFSPLVNEHDFARPLVQIGLLRFDDTHSELDCIVTILPCIGETHSEYPYINEDRNLLLDLLMAKDSKSVDKWIAESKPLFDSRLTSSLLLKEMQDEIDTILEMHHDDLPHCEEAFNIACADALEALHSAMNVVCTELRRHAFRDADTAYQQMAELECEADILKQLAIIAYELTLSRQVWCGNMAITEWLLKAEALKKGWDLILPSQSWPFDWAAMLTPNRDEFIRWFQSHSELRPQINTVASLG